MAVICHFRQQEVAMGEVTEFQVVSHFRPRRREHLDTMKDVSIYTF